MNSPLTRRDFLRASATAATAVTFSSALGRNISEGTGGFAFVVLGDLHYDKIEHHDLAWLDKNHPGDLGQIRNYSRLTAEMAPRLFATVREQIAELNHASVTPVAFVLQVGDLVEGLCGSEERSVRQNTEALRFVRDAQLGAPFLITKGNHDITGAGAPAAFATTFQPFLTDQVRALSPEAPMLTSARYSVEHGNAQFVFFDAYDRESLEWFEAVAARRTAEHFFAVIHPPVVPYGARATWHLFASPGEKSRREKLLALLGRQQAIVLGGHIHKFSSLARKAGGAGFAQFALSSVIASAEPQAKSALAGLADYTGDQVRVEADFSPADEAARRAVYATERPFVKAFAYADLPGYAVVTVDGPRVTAQMFAGVSRQRWRTVDLTTLVTEARA